MQTLSPCQAECSAARKLSGKKENMKCRRGNISKGQGEVSEGKRVHFSLASTYLSFSLYQAWSFAGKERIKTCMEPTDSSRGEREMGPSHLDAGENFSAETSTRFHEIPEGKEVHLGVLTGLTLLSHCSQKIVIVTEHPYPFVFLKWLTKKNHTPHVT